VACAATALLGLASALSPSYWWYLVLRCLVGAGASGIAGAAFQLSVEPVGPSWRAAATLASTLGGVAGACLLPLLAFLLPGWRALTLVVSALVGLALCMVVPSMPESPRWLINAGRKVPPSLHPSLVMFVASR
jgi:OCT family organic cation transporter-like MFS transporter 4/5